MKTSPDPPAALAHLVDLILEDGGKTRREHGEAAAVQAAVTRVLEDRVKVADLLRESQKRRDAARLACRMPECPRPPGDVRSERRRKRAAG